MTNSRPRSTVISLTIHAAAIALLLLWSKQVAPTMHPAAVELVSLTDPPRISAPSADAIGGGGGRHALVPASAGHLPKIALTQFVPPAIEIVNPNPKLVMESTIEGPPELALLDKALPNLGDPLSRFRGSSAGAGGPLGIGNGNGTGNGNKTGAAAGDGDAPYGPVYRAGSNGVTKPLLIHQVEPEFSEEARRAKYTGTVKIVADIDPNGRPRNLRVAKSLGLGLDEKALEAVGQWLFKPGTRDGKAVTVSAMIEVTFHLL
jgi:protein TonB